MGFHLNALKISCPGGPKTSAIGNAQGICIGGLRRIAAVISGFRYNLEPTSTAGNRPIGVSSTPLCMAVRGYVIDHQCSACHRGNRVDKNPISRWWLVGQDI